MPLPHFLVMLLLVVTAAGLTLWAVSAAGVPLFALAVTALLAAAAVHLVGREH
ncbi:hypothetical protein [Paracoccus sp. S-4012]|uniref:hypothetical protein n=1 Tax=Paracoccus sp. S-4012 TaxID=2665648 RepID=UPI001E636B05|nr:hypothetical protein [Paracoccus sp. S-4012]